MSSDVPMNAVEKDVSFPCAPNHTLYSGYTHTHTGAQNIFQNTLSHTYTGFIILVGPFHWRSLHPGPVLISTHHPCLVYLACNNDYKILVDRCIGSKAVVEYN